MDNNCKLKLGKQVRNLKESLYRIQEIKSNIQYQLHQENGLNSSESSENDRLRAEIRQIEEGLVHLTKAIYLIVV